MRIPTIATLAAVVPALSVGPLPADQSVAAERSVVIAIG